jgi:AcrR family transcriptional regulator
MSEMTTTRSTKEERRREIIEAATHEFAISGLYGTPVTAIAKRVGVSQPYLFQLFGTKKELFIAAVRRSFERTVATFRTAAAQAGPDADMEAILMSMGLAYAHLLEDDRTLLLMQLQAHAACEDPDVRPAGREEFLRLVRFVQSASGAPDDAVRPWLAEGMLMNAAAAMDLSQIDADWARMCTGEYMIEKFAKFHNHVAKVHNHGKGGGA